MKNIGYLDELIKEHDNPITYFTEVNQRMTEEENKSKSVQITINTNEMVSTSTSDLNNTGFTVLCKIYNELKIHQFIFAEKDI